MPNDFASAPKLERIEVTPSISNLAEMKAKGVGELHYTWSVSGGAVIKEIAPDKLILTRSQYTGPIMVKAAINNGGADSSSSVAITVKEPESDPWIERKHEPDEQPEDGQFYARDDKNEGTVYYNGVLEQAADEVYLKVYSGETLVATETAKTGRGSSHRST